MKLTKNVEKGSLALSLITSFVSITASTLVSFVISKYLIETVGSVTYSYYPIATSFANYFSIVFIAVNAMSSRFVMVSLLENKTEDAHEYYTSIFFSDLFLSIIVIVVMALFVINIDSVLDITPSLVNEIKLLFLYIILSVVVNAMCGAFTTATYAKNRMDVANIINLCSSITKLVLFAYYYATNTMTIVSYGIILLSAVVVKLLLNIIVSKKLLPSFSLDLSYYSKEKTKELLQSGFWIMINRIGILLINNLQLIITNITLGSDESADLSLVSNLYSFGALYCSAIESITTPLIVKLIINHSNNIDCETKIFQTLIVIVIVIPCSLLMAFGGSFHKLWLPNENSDTLYILNYLNISQLLLTYITLLANIMTTAQNKVKMPSLMMLIIDGFNIVTMYFVLKYTSLKTIGILLVNNLTYFIYYIVFLPLYARIISPYVKQYSGRLYILSLFILVASTLFGKLLLPDSYIQLFIYCGLCMLAEIVFTVIFMRVKVKSLIEFLTKK